MAQTGTPRALPPQEVAPPRRASQLPHQLPGDGIIPAEARRSPPSPAPRPLLPALAIATTLAVVLAGTLVGYHYWLEQALYVSTDNARVAGSLVQVGTLNAGQLKSVDADIGQTVLRDQVVAMVLLPSTLGVTVAGTTKLGFVGTEDQQVPVRAPIDGVVVARQGNPGDTVAVGQTVLTLIDPSRLWVEARVEETKIARVQPGQTVEVTVDSLGQSLPGRVTAVGRASSATFSLLPQGNTSGNFTKVTQLVPVRIEVDYSQLPLVLGTSVGVRIRVGE